MGVGGEWVLSPPSPQESALKALGAEGLFLFSSLDVDGDLHLSPEEFRPVAEKLTGTGSRGRLGPWVTPPRHCW